MSEGHNEPPSTDQKNKEMPIDPCFTVIGVTWYMPPDYLRMRKLFKDGAKLPRTYAQWLKSATAAQSMLEYRGFKVIKAYVDPDTFPAWCRARGLDIDGKARLRYGDWYVDNGFARAH